MADQEALNRDPFPYKASEKQRQRVLDVLGSEYVDDGVWPNPTGVAYASLRADAPAPPTLHPLHGFGFKKQKWEWPTRAYKMELGGKWSIADT